MIDYNSIHLSGFFVGTIFISFYWVFFLVGLLIIHRLVTESFRSGNFSIFDSKNAKFIDYPTTVNKIVFWSAVGWQAGGRLGYALLQARNVDSSKSPFFLFHLMQSGLSSRCAILGMFMATFFVAKNLNLSLPKLADILAFITPTFLFLMRISQFLSEPIPGKLTNLNYGVIFPGFGSAPRHPFRLYEAVAEGLFLQLFLILNKKQFTRQGRITCLFILGYIVAGDLTSVFIDPAVIPEVTIGFMSFRHFVAILLGVLAVYISFKWRSKRSQTA